MSAIGYQQILARIDRVWAAHPDWSWGECFRHVCDQADEYAADEQEKS